jgi:hypothetical protein
MRRNKKRLRAIRKELLTALVESRPDGLLSRCFRRSVGWGFDNNRCFGGGRNVRVGRRLGRNISCFDVGRSRLAADERQRQQQSKRAKKGLFHDIQRVKENTFDTCIIEAIRFVAIRNCPLSILCRQASERTTQTVDTVRLLTIINAISAPLLSQYPPSLLGEYLN